MGRLKLGKKDGITGTRDGICIYKMRGEYFIRSKSSLSGKRVKTSPVFKNTMLHAGILGRASRIASFVYRELPAAIREHSIYRSLTGDAIKLIKAGIEDDIVKDMLLSYSKVYTKGSEPSHTKIKFSSMPKGSEPSITTYLK